MRRVAERLVSYEAKQKRSRLVSWSAVLASEQLRPALVTLMGDGGFNALMSRALTLAAPNAGWLRALSVDSGGMLQGLEDVKEVDGAERLHGGTVLLAQLLGLLVTFIGEDLTLGVVRDVWPELSFDNPHLGKGSRT